MVNYVIDGNIGVISVDYPPVNALSHAVRQGLYEAIAAAQTDASEAIVLVCEGRTFIAGADITEFGKPPTEPHLPELLNVIEDSKKPVIAAIHGTALGGGFETTLAAHFRCAVASAKIGLPEVKLGLLPGAGGTQRTPRLGGVQAALDLMTSGNPIGAPAALELGLIDRIVEGDLREEAIAWARELVEEGVTPRKTSKQPVPDFDAAIFDGYRAALAKRARGQLAPQNIVACVEAATKLPFREGLDIERKLFLECMQSPQSAALRHLFFAERQAAKIDGLPKDTPQRRDRLGRHHRRWHDGRRHRHEFCQCRYSRHADRNE